MDCLFCKIAHKQIAATIVFENESIVAFRDIQPQAPVHILIIPKVHIRSIEEVGSEHEALLGSMICVAKDLAKQEALDNGYRLVLNVNAHGGQTVFHVHLHLLGGRQMTWPPG